MKDDKEVASMIEQISKQLEMLINDTSVPRNVRTVVAEAKEKLTADGDYIVRVSSAIYNLDSVSNDINLPQHARTMVWGVLSMLESIKTDE